MAEAGGTPTQYTEIAQASLKAMTAEKRLGDSEIRKAAKSKEAPKPPGIPEGVAEKVRGPESPDTAEGQLMTQASERVDGEQQQWDEISTISEKSRDARNTLLAYDQARQLALQGIKPKMTLTLEDVAGLTQTITQATGEINARSQKVAQERG